jgi:SAM-dependent methyltransferase
MTNSAELKHDDTPRHCRMCGAVDTLTDIGMLPDLEFFAGVKISQKLAGGTLQHCQSCFSMQRYPIYRQMDYTSLYINGSAEAWAGKTNRNDNRIIGEYIDRNPAIQSVLDIGCNVGELLSSLPPRLKKFGVEPSVGAKAIATDKGIEIIADTPDDIPASARFDCIVAVDVIEHIAAPNDFLEQLREHLNVGGMLILSTGNPQFKPWYKFFKTGFWYSSFPEHLSFPSQNHYRHWATSKGMTLEEPIVFSYSQGRPLRFMVIFLLQYSFLLSRRLHGLIVKLVFGHLLNVPSAAARPFFLPCSGLFKDHHICIIRNKNS